MTLSTRSWTHETGDSSPGASALMRNPGPRGSPGTTITRADFHLELADLREEGWSLSRDERVLGTTAIAAPVLSANGECLAAVQIAGPLQSPAFKDTSALGYEVR